MALNLIGKLHGIERDCKDVSNEERLAARQSRSGPVLEQLKRWLDKTQPNTLPQTALGKAVNTSPATGASLSVTSRAATCQWTTTVQRTPSGRL